MKLKPLETENKIDLIKVKLMYKSECIVSVFCANQLTQFHKAF